MPGSFVALHLALLGVLCLSACAGPSARKAVAPNPGEVVPSRAAVMSFLDARAQYERLSAEAVPGVTRARAVQDVAVTLDRAIASDPKFPLWLSRKGELMLELDPPRTVEAEDLFRRSLGPGISDTASTGSERWAPGWIGIAKLQARAGKLDDARESLRQADRAMTWFEAAPPQNVGGLIGLLSGQARTYQPAPDDPTLPETLRKQILSAAMADDAAWDVAATPLGVPDMAAATLDSKRRIRAEIEFQRALLDGSEADPDAFERVFRWNPDHFLARYEQASRLVRASRFTEADAVFIPYVDARNPKLMNQPDVLLLVATIHTRNYLATGAVGKAQLADEMCRIMDQRHPWDARAYILHAQVLARWGTDTKDPAKVSDAKVRADAGEQKLLEFEKPGGPFVNQVPQWRAELAAAREAIRREGQ